MHYLTIKNWDKFQHYKRRTPPWIKLHRDLLNNYEFSCLQDASKLHLMLIWLLASQMDNQVPADPNWLKQKLQLDTLPDLKALADAGFIELASNMLASCKQSATPETETETETETEKKGQTASRFVPPSILEVRQYCEARQNRIDAEAFVAFYASKNWMIGKNKMKSWKDAIITWEKRDAKDQRNQTRHQTGTAVNDYLHEQLRQEMDRGAFHEAGSDLSGEMDEQFTQPGNHGTGDR